jgi:uncharacterized protein (TIGR03083 family)
MPTHVDRETVIAALDEEWHELARLLADLADDEWSTPSPLEGWDVQAVVAHVIGTESMLAGVDPPAGPVDRSSFPHIRNDIGAFNEQWIVGLADRTPDEMRAGFSEITAQRRGALAAMDDEAWSEEGFTPAGQDTYGRFMRIRLFDTWLHEQDIRDVVGRPGHESGAAVEQTLDEMSGAMGYVVGKLAGAPDGSSVTFDLTGDAARAIHIRVDGRAAVVESLDGPATVTLHMPVGVWVRLAGGRVNPDEVTDQIVVDGDAALGASVLDHLNYTI